MENNENTLGGALWINLLNTKRLIEGKMIDFLDDKQFFFEWLKDNGLKVNNGEMNGHQIEKLKDLRDNFNSVMEEISQGVPLAENHCLVRINQLLASIPVILSAGLEENGLKMVLHAKDQVNELSLQFIQSFLDTSEQYSFEKVRQCAHEECVLYFLDTSKSGKRKWCSMETCGNRKKASKHYSKKTTKL